MLRLDSLQHAFLETTIRSARLPADSGTASSLPTTKARPPSGWTTSTSRRSPGQVVYEGRTGMT
jgi:hypothetical protein